MSDTDRFYRLFRYTCTGNIGAPIDQPGMGGYYNPKKFPAMWETSVGRWMNLVAQCVAPRVVARPQAGYPNSGITLWDGKKKVAMFVVPKDREVDIVSATNARIIELREEGHVGEGVPSPIMTIRGRLARGEFVAHSDISAAFVEELGVDNVGWEPTIHVRVHSTKLYATGVGMTQNAAQIWGQYVIFVPPGTKVSTDAPLTRPT